MLVEAVEGLDFLTIGQILTLARQQLLWMSQMMLLSPSHEDVVKELGSWLLKGKNISNSLIELR